jgi:biotin carboxyl carrier protein
VIYEATARGRTARVEVRGKDGRYTVSLDGRERSIDVRETGGGLLSLLLDGRSYDAGLERGDGVWRVGLPEAVVEVSLAEAPRDGALGPRKAAGGPLRLAAPMPGKIVRVLAAEGQEVEAGEGLLVMEAMKMENEIRAPRAGCVREVAVREQQAVETGALLVLME